MGYYNKYPGYIIRQRQENTGSLNTSVVNLTGTITYVGGATDALGPALFESREVPFVFHQPNLPSFKLSCIPYKVVDSSMYTGDDNTYQLSPTSANCNYGKGSFIITDEFIMPQSLQEVTILTVPADLGNLYLTDVYLWVTDINPATSPSYLQFSIGSDASYINICANQATTNPGFNLISTIGLIFRTRFSTAATPDPIALRGPINPGTVIKLKNQSPQSYPQSPPAFKFKIVFKGYYA